jgi:hypothetical protein
MGKLTNLNPPAPIADGDLPPSIARDAEFQAADEGHANAQHPHPQYRKNNEAQVFANPIKAICKSTGAPNATGLASGNAGLEIQADPPTSGAFFYLSRPGIFGAHVGIDSTNRLGFGGGNLPGFYYLCHEGTSIHARVALPAAVIGAGSSGLGWNAISGTAEFCNYANTGTGDAFNFYRLPGNANSPPGAVNRISRIDASGAYLQVSDRRVKKKLTPAPGLDVLLKLEPLKYEHWEAVEFDEKGKALKLGEGFIDKLGFIAQDVQKYLPEAVTSPASEKDLHSLDYNGILTVAVQAIKDLHEKVASLELQLQALPKS